MIVLLKKYRYIIILSLIAGFSFTLNFYAISKIGYGNAYYAAAIRSMSQNFHHFFYVSFDPAGVVSVDKPPLGLWIQTIFVLIFGYHGWAMILPQALAGTGSCILMYVLTSRYFGRNAGIISALVFSLTPAVVVASRNNTMDMQLIFCLLTATWFLFQAIEKSKKSALFLTAIIIGLGFNIKMLQAYMILPAVVIVYIIFSKFKPVKRLLYSFVSLLILIAVSLAWVTAVDLTPVSKRPYVGSSADNTETELIIGHNGMERLFGSSFSTQQSNTPTIINKNIFNPNKIKENNMSSVNSHQVQTQASGRGIVGNDTGNPGMFRLWEKSLYGQISWLMILALFCIIVNLKKFSLRNRTMRQAAFIYWILWLAAMYLFFSFAQFWHRYYLCMFAPAIAGLAGPGIITMYRMARGQEQSRKYWLPICLIATYIPQILYVWNYTELRRRLAIIMIAGCGVSLILMGLYFFRNKIFLLRTSVVCMLACLLIGPLYWSYTVTRYICQNSTMPYAGPELKNNRNLTGMTPNQENFVKADAKTIALEHYLVSHYQKGSYLVISQRANDVAEFIIDTGLPAVCYGGFSGVDDAITVNQLKQLVSEKKATYFLLSNQMIGFADPYLISYLEEHATLINPAEYGQASSIFYNEQKNLVSLYLFKPEGSPDYPSN